MGRWAIISVLANLKSMNYAASICLGGKPPLALLGRSLVPEPQPLRGIAQEFHNRMKHVLA